MTYPVCPCDAEAIAAPANLPELSHIAYRAGDYVSFRQAVLTVTPLFDLPAPTCPIEHVRCRWAASRCGAPTAAATWR